MSERTSNDPNAPQAEGYPPGWTDERAHGCVNPSHQVDGRHAFVGDANTSPCWRPSTPPCAAGTRACAYPASCSGPTECLLGVYGQDLEGVEDPGDPTDLAERVSADVTELSRDPELAAGFKAGGFLDHSCLNPRACAACLQEELSRAGAAVAGAGLQPGDLLFAMGRLAWVDVVRNIDGVIEWEGRRLEGGECGGAFDADGPTTVHRLVVLTPRQLEDWEKVLGLVAQRGGMTIADLFPAEAVADAVERGCLVREGEHYVRLSDELAASLDLEA